MRLTRSALCLVLTGLFALNAHAGVYKWTDAQGRVHYSDTPPPGREAQRVQTGRSNEAEAAAARKSLADKLTESELRRKKAQEEEERRKAEEAKQRAKAEQCLKAREQLTLLQRHNRITRVDPQGQSYLVGDAERMAMIQEAQQRVAELCN
jgi:hypothetical protein